MKEEETAVILVSRIEAAVIAGKLPTWLRRCIRLWHTLGCSLGRVAHLFTYCHSDIEVRQIVESLLVTDLITDVIVIALPMPQVWQTNQLTKIQSTKY